MTYLDIYSNPRVYDAFYRWKTNDIQFTVNCAKNMGSPVLELAAGTGRLAVPILEAGIRYFGIDKSPEFVKWAKLKLKKFHGLGNITVDDMTDFRIDEKFQLIFIGFNSIFHLYTHEDIVSCFSAVHRHLSDTGTFLIDCFVPDTEFLHRDENRYYSIGEFDGPDEKKVNVKEKNNYDPVTQINHIKWYFFTEGKDVPEIFEFDMHMIFPDTMDRLLYETGFVIREKLGDYDGASFDENSPLQIYMCEKK